MHTKNRIKRTECRERRQRLRLLHDIDERGERETRRQHDRVDLVHDAVGCDEVGGRHVRKVKVDLQLVVRQRHKDVERAALHCRGLRVVLEVGGLDRARDDVVLEHGLQRRLVGRQQQRVDNARRQRRKGRVGRRNHGERAGAAQRRHEVGGLEGGDCGGSLCGGREEQENKRAKMRRIRVEHAEQHA